MKLTVDECCSYQANKNPQTHQIQTRLGEYCWFLFCFTWKKQRGLLLDCTEQVRQFILIIQSINGVSTVFRTPTTWVIPWILLCISERARNKYGSNRVGLCV